MFKIRQILPKVRTIVFNNTKQMSTSNNTVLDLNVDSEGIAVLRMQRSPVNSISLDFAQELGKSVDIAIKEKCKGLVLTSAFPTVFSAGIDLGELHKPDVKRLETFWSTYIDAMIKFYSSPIASAVAINGHSAAGACVLTMMLEYRVMVNRKIAIGFNDTAVGVVPSEWIITIMSEVIGKRQAEKAIIGSTMFSPEEALKVGLVDELASDDADAVEKCKKFIRKLVNISPSIRAATKQLIRKPLLNNLSENKQHYVNYMVQSIINPETQQILDDYVKIMKLKKTEKVNKSNDS